MHQIAKLAHGFLNRVTFSTPLPEPEPINHKPRPTVGFFAGLSAEQKSKALAYRGPEDHGESGHKAKA